MTGEEHRGLSGGVAAADNRDLLTGAQLCFQHGGPVPDPATLEFCKSWHSGTAITRAARNDDRSGPQRAAVRELQPQLPIAPCLRTIKRCCLGWYQHFRAEFLRLHERTTRERLTRDAGRKSEIVLDARTRAGLATERTALYDNDPQSFRRCVTRGGEPGSPRPDHRDIEQFVALERIEHSKTACKRVFRRREQHRAIRTRNQ